jgi:hypothetical protein
MATPTQYSFELNEVATALIKAQNIHEGKWWVAFEFLLGTGLLGGQVGSPDAFPGGFFTIRRITLAQATAEPPPPPHLIVDAAIVNPRPRTIKSKARS